MTIKKATTLDELQSELDSLKERISIAEAGSAQRPVSPDAVIIRSVDSGVWLGNISETSGSTVSMTNARRLWWWEGAATLSQLAMEGTNKPNLCKFPCVVEKVTVLGVCEIIPVTQKALDSLNAVAVWSS